MRRIRLAIVLSLAAAVAVGVVVAAGSAQTGPGRTVPATAAGLRMLQGVNFIESCAFSHRNSDDPIVFPGQAGVSHNHTFVGNVSTDASSTLLTLSAAATTCRRDDDRAAYWVPTLFDGSGNAVEPVGATIYYRRRTLAPVQPFPAGLRMIAGNARATVAQSTRVTFWNCGVDAGVEPGSEIPACPAGRRTGLRLHVTFPSCWDGRRLDSPDHQSHMAYAVAGNCPSGHPIAVPAISVIVRYPVAGGEGYRLASGGELTGHADFFNAWQQSTLTRLVDSCLNELRHCGRGA